jgi:DNA-binding MarR family transcriptional regulator
MGSHASREARAALDAIRRIVQLLRKTSRESEMRTGLSAAQLFVLQQLRAAGTPLTPSELARRTLTHQSSVSVVVGRLVEARLVRRVASARDRRRVELSLTERGQKTARAAPALAQERLIAAVESLSPGRRTALVKGLRQLTRQLGIADEAPPMFFEEAMRRAK